MAMSFDDAIRMAAEAIRSGDLVWGEALARGVLEKSPGDSRAMELLIALTKQVGQPRTHDADTSRPRYLLIRSWGKGFWSDVDHVLGSLFAAGITGRSPIVHWGSNCLFTAPGIENAWLQFFEPTNAHTIADVARSDLSFFPPKWSAGNLRQENVNVWQGPGSRVTGVALLNRPEDVVVCDFHVAVPALIPWIEPGSPHHGQAPRELYRELFSRFVHPRREVLDEVEAFHAKHLAGGPYLAVHWRGSDKYQEQRALAEINQQAFAHIDGAPAWKIFLLTDDARAVGEFQKRYADRVVLADAERSSTLEPVHARPLAGGGGARRGREVLRDTLLAARADRFIGNGGSNVAAAVVHLKNWDDRDLILLAPVRQYRTMPVLYRPR
jgi:hypothetical protein